MRTRIHLAALAGVVAAAAVIIPAHAELPEKSKVTICHATGAEGHWVKQNVAVDAILRKNGHAYHQGGRDIIPPFNPVGDLPTFAGLNWDDAGKAIWKNGCVVPAVPTPTPTPSESATPTPEPTSEPSTTVTATPSETPDPTPTPTVTAEPSPDPTPTVTATASPDPQPTETVTEPAPTVTVTEPAPTVTETPTPAPTVTATVTVTSSPSFTPTASSTSTTDPWADFDSDEILADVTGEVHAVYPWHEGNRHPSDRASQQPQATVPGLPSTGANR